MRWITVGLADQPGTSIVLEPLAADRVGCGLVGFRAPPFVLTTVHTESM